MDYTSLSVAHLGFAIAPPLRAQFLFLGGTGGCAAPQLHHRLLSFAPCRGSELGGHTPAGIYKPLAFAREQPPTYSPAFCRPPRLRCCSASPGSISFFWGNRWLRGYAAPPPAILFRPCGAEKFPALRSLGTPWQAPAAHAKSSPTPWLKNGVYTRRVLSNWRNWIASNRSLSVGNSCPARSAMVRATRRMRSKARAERANCSTAPRSISCWAWLRGQ